ncbi:MAG: hypothetical protein ACKV2Q_25650 [Planctomycetaceae bacterium]
MCAPRVHSKLGFAEVRMAFEMICGQCRGNLMVEHFGVVVACPHCGAHLHVPDPAAPAAPAEEPRAQEGPWLAPSAHNPVPAPPTEELHAFTGTESEPPPSIEISVAPSITVSEAPEGLAPTTSVLDEPPSSETDAGAFSLSKLLTASVTDEPITPETPNAVPLPSGLPTQTAATAASVPAAPVAPPMTPAPVAAPTQDVSGFGLSGIFGSSTSASPSSETAASAEPPANTSASSPAPAALTDSDPPFSAPSQNNSLAPSTRPAAPPPATARPPRNDQVTVSKAMFVVLISYASAATLGFGYLLYQMKSGGAGPGLEALPDPVPVKKTGFQWYPPRTVMTAGHNLEIGDWQRFGNIKVTVLKVTRGPIQFRHFSNAQQTRRPTFPVLKLWLRFENVSDDQVIAPLDDQLLFRRSGNNYTEYKSSQFVCRADQKTREKPKIVIAYDHVVGSGWDLAKLPLEKPLAPHESREYFVPTVEQGLDDLVGDLVWRVQIRKGYSARGNGVTTLFEVHFNSNDIHDENA